MPVHESPPPSVRIIDPIAPSRPSTPGSERSRRPSIHIPSRVTSQLGLDPKGGIDCGNVDDSRGTAWYAGFSVGKLLDHRWFAWIRPNLKWDLLKPVVRCAVAAWVGWVVQLVQPSQAALGEAAFFVLIVAFIVPPHQAAVQVLESLANMYFFAGLSWAWACLGIFVAHSVRDPVNPGRVSEAEERYAYAADDPAQFQRLITYAGTYIQAKPSIVLAVWLAIGCGTLLWYKLRTQPSPATFPIVLACILMDIALTTAVFLPEPFYTAGLLFFLPMAVQGGIAVLATLFIFPRSVSHVFQSKMGGILNPLRQGFTSTEALFADARAQALPADLDDGIDLPGRLEKWAEESRRIRAQLLGSLSGVGPLRALSKYLIVDFSFSRLSGNDLKEVFDQLVLVQIRSAGIGLFYDVISSNARHSHLDSAAFDAHANSRPPSRAASVVELSEIRNDRQQDDSSPPSTPGQAPGDHRQFQFFAPKRSASPMRNGRASHLSLLEHLRRAQQPVGVYESQRYMDIERVFSQDTESVIRQLDLMADAALPVIQTCSTALDVAADWLQHANRPKRMSRASGDGLQQAISGLEKSLHDFKQDRLQILLPFRHLFDPNHPPVDLTYKMSYRGLFQNFVAEYHVMEFAHTLLALLVVLDRLDTSRIQRQFWYPRPTTVWRHLRGLHQSKDDRDDGEEQTNEDFVGDDELLGEVKKRNPEHTPFDNRWLNALSYLGRVTDVLHSRSFWYAMKAGAITILAALPGFIASSANFYYLHRGVWVLIMAQLTLAAYSGDTTSAFLARLVSSFWGCVFGMVAWYIGSGSGRGNPYGLAAVGAVTFPIAMFFRIHFPGPVLTAVFAPVTFGLVLGYSYLNATLGSLTEATWGWDVAWRRFLSVSIGITAAWIFAYLPPSFSTRRAIRQTYSRSIIAAGAIFCDILSDANGHHSRMYDNPDTRAKLLTWRSKLNAMGTRHQNALHEYSFKGRWPEERYQALQVAVSDLLALMAQLRHVYLQLDRPWRKALLERTRLNDLRFLGDVLAVLSMSSTALRSGTALPQITPSPLVERFRRGKYKGIQLPDSESAEIPALVTVEVLESEAYMRFAVGVTTTFSIMARLDRIVVICKTLLGESYHISGLHYDADAGQV